MAFEPKDYLIGAGCLGTVLAIAAGVLATGAVSLTLSSLVWYGAQVKSEVATGTTRILGEDVPYRVLEKNFGREVLFCLDGTPCVPKGAYTDHLEDIVDQRESEILEK